MIADLAIGRSQLTMMNVEKSVFVKYLIID
jgi:hypothetical protein